MRYVLMSIGLSLTLVAAASAGDLATASLSDHSTAGLRRMAADAVSENRSLAETTIKSLREAGPDGLAALLSVHQGLVLKHAIHPDTSTNDAFDPAVWQRLQAALDAVGGQRDCAAAKLYWYTDFEAAKAAAHREGKPILSLRLLGNLTDEFSCANSRFFRTTLYANDEVSRVLRERFVLHWQSVRPVPKVTIDFGDGRKLERTLTGNSIHYILDSDGRVIDALPGLYGPKAFLRELEGAEAAAKQADAQRYVSPGIVLAAYHRGRVAAIRAAWQADLQELGALNWEPRLQELGAALPAAAGAVTLQANPGAKAAPPTAARAGSLAIGKGSIEMPILRATATVPAETLVATTTDELWNRIAGLHSRDAQLDPASIALIRSQQPTAAKAAPRAISKWAIEDPLVRMVRKFQGSIALDTVRNEYLFHRQIHEWLAEAAESKTDVPLDKLNERVYAELFLTPSSDPWLGLMPADTYTALEDGGVVQAKGK